MFTVKEGWEVNQPLCCSLKRNIKVAIDSDKILMFCDNEFKKKSLKELHVLFIIIFFSF